ADDREVLDGEARVGQRVDGALRGGVVAVAGQQPPVDGDGSIHAWVGHGGLRGPSRVVVPGRPTRPVVDIPTSSGAAACPRCSRSGPARPPPRGGGTPPDRGPRRRCTPSARRR